MDRRRFLALAGASVAATVAGCSSSTGGTGELATRVSDQPGDIGDFETLRLQIGAVYVKPADAEREEYEADSEVDLTQLVGEDSALVDEQELETGDYDYLQLQAEAAEATLSDGSSAAVQLPGDAPLKFEKAFEIRADQTTTFTADFTPVKQGQTSQYTLQPVADEVTVVYEDAGTATGTASGSGY